MLEFPFTIVPVVLDEDINGKHYWFYVPNDCLIIKGASVVVLTSKGCKSGKAVDDCFVVMDKDDCPKYSDHLKPVLWVSQSTCMQENVPVSKIIVPDRFKKSYPAASKIEEKYKEFIKDPKKLSLVQLDSAYNIMDGYITFLLYRMFGYNSVPCMFLPHKTSLGTSPFC